MEAGTKSPKESSMVKIKVLGVERTFQNAIQAEAWKAHVLKNRRTK